MFDYLLSQHGEQVFVAAVPVHENAASRQLDLSSDSDEAEDVRPKELATAARVLQVSRNIQVKWVLDMHPCATMLLDSIYLTV